MKRSRINPVSKKRAEKLAMRKGLRERIIKKREWCEARIDGCTRVPSDVHEIQTRARGGNYWDDDNNCLALCRWCHKFITENPAWATEHGFIVHAWATPADKRAAKRARTLFTYGVVEND